jgi:hypothetical protein
MIVRWCSHCRFVSETCLFFDDLCDVSSQNKDQLEILMLSTTTKKADGRHPYRNRENDGQWVLISTSHRNRQEFEARQVCLCQLSEEGGATVVLVWTSRQSSSPIMQRSITCAHMMSMITRINAKWQERWRQPERGVSFDTIAVITL